MPKIKVQEKKVTSKGKEYKQYWIALPKALCESMRIEKGSELEVFIERGDLILRLVRINKKIKKEKEDG
jgi:bifunctional DNA-binding transcriptional regulator/antitoxin component of YhaV-PrlF toxin-antitoxin module